MNEFKVGDKVYFPKESTKIFTLEDNGVTLPYPLGFGFGTESFTKDGKYHVRDITPSLFLATPENQAKLEAFYGIPFEPAPPKPKPTPKEIIKGMLDKGDKYVLCLAGNTPEQIAEGRGVPTAVVAVDEGSKFCFHTASYYWEYAIPIDPQGNEITEMPEGEYYE